MTKEFDDRFKFTAEEEEQLSRMTQIEQEKYKALRHNAIQAEIDAQRIKQANAENKIIISGDAPEPSSTDPEVKVQPFVLRREFLIKSAFRPNFNTVKGCFIRIRINNEYRAGRIIGISEIGAYKLPNKRNQKDVYCNVGLNVDAGKRVINNWPLVNVSEQELKSGEFNKFVKEYELTKETFDAILKKVKKVKTELTRNMTDAEITEYLKKKNKANPAKESTTAMKMRLIKKREDAIKNKNRVAAEEAQRMLEEIEDKEYIERMKGIRDEDELKEWMTKRREASGANINK